MRSDVVQGNKARFSHLLLERRGQDGAGDSRGA